MDRETTDFSKILTNLQDWGFNDYKMAELTGIERTGLSRLRKGGDRGKKQPNYDDGVAIMQIYKREKKKAGA